MTVHSTVAAEILAALQAERERPLGQREIKAGDQLLGAFAVWVEATRDLAQGSRSPTDGWMLDRLASEVASWPDGPLKTLTESFLSECAAAIRERNRQMWLEGRRTGGNFRGEGLQESQAGPTATHDTVWSLVSFFESSANARSALERAKPWADWAIEDAPHWHSKWAAIRARHPIDPTLPPDVDDATTRIAAAVRHAHAYFDAAQRSPNTVRPNLLYYGCLALARALGAATFKDIAKTHGLKAEGSAVRVFRKGEFADLHDVLCTLPEIYAGASNAGRAIEFNTLLSAVDPLRPAIVRVHGPNWEWLGKAMANNINERRWLDDMAGHRVSTHAMAVDLMVLFYLSHWSRYEPVAWDAVLRGEKTGEAHIYVTFMDYVSLHFPLQTANYLMGVNNVFGGTMSQERVKQVVSDTLGKAFGL